MKTEHSPKSNYKSNFTLNNDLTNKINNQRRAKSTLNVDGANHHK